MKSRLLPLLAAWACLVSPVARAEELAPRDIWPQAMSAADAGNLDAAAKKTSELTETGRTYGIKTYPLYAVSAASLSRQAARQGTKPEADWAAHAADALDPISPAVAFIGADTAADSKNWGAALTAALRGFTNILRDYRSRLLGRADLLITILLALALTAAIFAVSLLVRYGRAMTHDFREILGGTMHGGSVSVLAFALLFLPVFLWLGPVWLMFYWFIIFFSYAKRGERILIVLLSLLIASAPLALDLASHWIAGVDSPVVMSAIASEERSYQPDALRRMQELINIVPDDAVLHLLIGNLCLQDGDEQQANLHYRRSVDLHDSAGAHVNLGDLHFFNNDFATAVTEYNKAETLDPRLAIAYYDDSIALGELYKFDQQAQKLDQAKKMDRSYIERLNSEPPAQKVVLYHPTIPQAWAVSSSIARRGVARSLFGNYAWFDPAESVRNPLTLGAILAVILAPLVFLKRRRAGFAGQCIKCGRTFCPRCKSAHESTTFCTQCIHIYLKRDGVSMATKRAKLEEVSEHLGGVLTRNRWLASFLPGSAQLIEGRTVAGTIGSFVFVFFVSLALLSGRLAPVLAPGEVAKTIVRIVAILLAFILWLLMTLPIYRRRVTAV
ncbi:MAG TPA: tetratricopeptide repeat protein [Thermoanaerobaculia bacterium]|jgi:tetratricopeptide (TPR) repeat protein|nr:tetratricopeptide repeat protein [Thermoanaerobaculia bacterium]